MSSLFFFFQAEDGIRVFHVTGVQTCALPIWWVHASFLPDERSLRVGSSTRAGLPWAREWPQAGPRVATCPLEGRRKGSSVGREIRAPRGAELSCRGWPQEAALRMLMNNLDPDVAERPQDLVVYGGTGKAARNWDAYDAIVRTLRGLGDDETLLVQSGKPVGVFRTQPSAPRVLISNAMLVPKWADWETFWELERAGLTMYGQMTAGSWIYIGTQGILQGTYETLAECASQHFGGSLRGRRAPTAGLGGMPARLSRAM